jgi:hypothetical protein
MMPTVAGGFAVEFSALLIFAGALPPRSTSPKLCSPVRIADRTSATVMRGGATPAKGSAKTRTNPGALGMEGLTIRPREFCATGRHRMG